MRSINDMMFAAMEQLASLFTRVEWEDDEVS